MSNNKFLKPIYLAPMEGITGYVFRNSYFNVYGNIEKYFTPFIVPVIKREFKSRELRDIIPDNNKNMYTVPQILTNNSHDFFKTVENLKKYEYKEVNINMGCPSGTVVSKNKGAGFLSIPDKMDEFLYEIFSNIDVRISVKTRIGMESEDEFYKLLDIFNKYPLEEIIIHPRLRKDFYKNEIHMEIFDYAYKKSKNPICYNGDIVDINDYFNIIEKYPDIKAVMIGRGIISNPDLACEIFSNGKYIDNKKDKTAENIIRNRYRKLKEFHNILYEGYKLEIQGDINVLYKMKEMWFYFSKNFENKEKNIKKIKKSKNLREYENAVGEIFYEDKDTLSYN